MDDGVRWWVAKDGDIGWWYEKEVIDGERR